MLSAPIPAHATTAAAHTTRIARASVGKRARRRRQMPGGCSTCHQKRLPTAASIDLPAMNMARRPAANSRAACNSPLTVAKVILAALRATTVVDDREGEAAAPWTPALDSASAPRRSRRQPVRPRSSRVGSKAMAMAAAKAIAVRRLSSSWLYAPVASNTTRSSAKASEAPLPGPGVDKRAVLLVSEVVRLALKPVGKVGSVTRHAAVPTLGGAEPRLVLVEPEPQTVRCNELCRHELILLRRADAGRSTQRNSEVERSGGTKKQLVGEGVQPTGQAAAAGGRYRRAAAVRRTRSSIRAAAGFVRRRWLSLHLVGLETCSLKKGYSVAALPKTVAVFGGRVIECTQRAGARKSITLCMISRFLY
eukprot:scaffold1480_cov57-Phaeocystis_antarctica.AAC.4